MLQEDLDNAPHPRPLPLETVSQCHSEALAEESIFSNLSIL